MSEREPRDLEMDHLLRRSIADPIPTLPPDFEQRFMRELRRSRQPLDQYRQLLVIAYALLSVVVSAVVMRGQGLGWGPISGMILGRLALVAAHWARQVARRTLSRR